MTMPHDAAATVRQFEILQGLEEHRSLQLDCLREKLSGTRTQNAGQRIIERVRLTKSDNTAILFHGVSLSLRGSGRLDTRLDTPPISYRHHPGSRLALSLRILGGDLSNDNHLPTFSRLVTKHHSSA